MKPLEDRQYLDVTAAPPEETVAFLGLLCGDVLFHGRPRVWRIVVEGVPFHAVILKADAAASQNAPSTTRPTPTKATQPDTDPT